MGRVIARFLLGLCLLLCLVPPAAAQDPTPLRHQLTDPPARIRAEASLQGAIDRVTATWPESAPRVAAGLGLTDPAPVDIVLLTDATFRRWSRGLIPEWGAGYASWPTGPIVLAVGRPGPKTLEEVLRHELSHVYVGQRIARTGLPRWFVEGVAQRQSGEWRFLDTVSMVRTAGMGGMPSLAEIGGRFPASGPRASLAYQLSLYAITDLEGRLEAREPLRLMVDTIAARGSFEIAFRELFGMGSLDYSRQLHESMEVRYGWIFVVANATSLFTLGGLVLTLGAARAYRRKRSRMAEMEREEALADAETPESRDS